MQRELSSRVISIWVLRDHRFENLSKDNHIGINYSCLLGDLMTGTASDISGLQKGLRHKMTPVKVQDVLIKS